MEYKVKRYNLNKGFVAQGILSVEEQENDIILTYADNEIKEEAVELYHPIVALEVLRKKLEVNHYSIISINGCRIDTAYRPTGRYGTYIIKEGKKAKKSISLFEPTMEIDKLCVIEEHIVAYRYWLASL